VSDTLAAFSTRVRARTSIDLGLAVGLITLGLFGVVMIYSATRQLMLNAGDNPHYYFERQLLFVIIGIVIMFVIAHMDYRRFESAATPLYVCALLGLAGVFLVGQTALGAQRWYSLGFIQIQPSEFTVLFIILAVATYCQRRPEGLTMYDVFRLLLMGGTPLLMIAAQPDLGTAIIIVITVSAILVVAGVPPRFMTLLAVVGSIGAVSAVYFDLLHRYQINRLFSFINPNSKNPKLQTLLYEVNNAKSAIGSGGIHGSGLFRGMQTVLGYVPEQRTDFIFTAIGEQLGFIGTSLVILLLAFVAWRMFVIGRNAKDTMGRLICLGVFIFFAFSCFENIGMTMGIMPVTGIPLPLLSYGGSAAVVFFAGGGAVLSVSRRTGN
jgi:rod shape determining protein RodA